MKSIDALYERIGGYPWRNETDFADFDSLVDAVRDEIRETIAEFPRRQAMLSIREPHYKNGVIDYEEVARVPVFVWPMPTSNGLFIVEHQDGTVQRVQPDSLTFLGSKELFDQYDWSE